MQKFKTYGYHLIKEIKGDPIIPNLKQVVDYRKSDPNPDMIILYGHFILEPGSEFMPVTIKIKTECYSPDDLSGDAYVKYYCPESKKLRLISNGFLLYGDDTRFYIEYESDYGWDTVHHYCLNDDESSVKESCYTYAYRLTGAEFYKRNKKLKK